jgi:hypothetical protein
MATTSLSVTPALSVALLGEGGMLAQAFDKELFLLVHQGVVDGSSAQIHSGHYFHGFASGWRSIRRTA